MLPHTVGRFLTPKVYEDTPYIAYLPFFKFCSTLLSSLLLPTSTHPTPKSPPPHCSNAHTHTQRHTAQSGANILKHPYKYKLKPPVMCSQYLSILHWMNNLWISKIYFPRCILFQKLLTYRGHISVVKTKFLLWTTLTLIEIV